MNPFVHEQLKQLQRLLNELEETTLSLKEDLQEQRKAFVKLRKDYWERSTDISILEATEGDYKALKAEAERLRNRHKELRKHLAHVLDHTKALASRFNR